VTARQAGEHVDDTALLDALDWVKSSWQPCCDRCGHRAATVVIGWVDSGSGPGYDVRNCRRCVGLYLTRARKAAEQRGKAYTPALPRYH
jgi:hypothetical protein